MLSDANKRHMIDSCSSLGSKWLQVAPTGEYLRIPCFEFAVNVARRTFAPPTRRLCPRCALPNASDHGEVCACERQRFIARLNFICHRLMEGVKRIPGTSVTLEPSASPHGLLRADLEILGPGALQSSRAHIDVAVMDTGVHRGDRVPAAIASLAPARWMPEPLNEPLAVAGSVDDLDGRPFYLKTDSSALQTWSHQDRLVFPMEGGYTEAHRHFGYRVTSQVESQHASLKATLPRIALRRKQALTVLLDQWWSWWEARFKSAQLQLNKQKETDYWMREDRFFAHVKGRIARHALEVAKEQTTAALQAATEVDPYDYQCTYDLRTNDEPLGSHDGCSIWTVRGVPGSHRIQIFLHSGQQSLEVTDFASFYHLPDVIADDAQTVHPDGISTQATLRSDWAQAGAELQEHYVTVGGLPGNHSQRIKCAKQAYLNGTVIDSAIWTSPKKAITATAKTHNSARRLLTKLERSKRATKAKLYRDSRRCFTCGGPHNKNRCPNNNNEPMKALWAVEKKDIEAAKREKRKRQRQEQQEAEELEHLFPGAEESVGSSPDTSPSLLAVGHGRDNADSLDNTSEFELLDSKPAAMPARPKMRTISRDLPRGLPERPEVIALAATVSSMSTPTVLDSKTTANQLWSMMCRRKAVKARASGHCGWESLLIGLRRTKEHPVEPRLQFFEYLATQGLLDFPDVSKDHSIWLACREQTFKGGKIPTEQAMKAFRNGCDSKQWLHSGQLPYLAQMLQRVICICHTNTSATWATSTTAAHWAAHWATNRSSI